MQQRRVEDMEKASSFTLDGAAGRVEDEPELNPESDEDEVDKKYKLSYGVDEIPPPHVTALVTLQQLITNLGGPITAVYMLQAAVCADNNPMVFAELLSTTLFVMGICTFLEVALGIRLPIVQGSSYSFIPPIVAMMSTAKWRCPPESCYDHTNELTTASGIQCDAEPWVSRLQEISGGLIVASLFQVLLGCCGLVGWLMRHIGPLTIVPTVTMISLSLFQNATRACQHQWGIAFMVAALYILFALILRDINVPFPYWSKSKGCHVTWFPFFRLVPALLSRGIAWILCAVLTIYNVFPDDPTHANYRARTDVKLQVISDAKWFYWPYPGQWGWPTFGAGIFIGMLAATISSVIESIGDYYISAKISQQPPPPKHAMNRGIAMEGIGAVIGGFFGIAHATTSYSGSITYVTITGVASRVVYILLALLFLISGIIGKVGAALSVMPDPVIGGSMVPGMGMLISIGLLPLQYLPLKSVRNMMILGTSIMLAMMLPFYILDNPEVINTGYSELDQVIMTFLSTAMCVGGVVGFILDNIIPGSRKERGIAEYLKHLGIQDDDHDTVAEPCRTYDLPFISDWLRRRHKIFTYIPFLPSYKERKTCLDRDRICPCRKPRNVIDTRGNTGISNRGFAPHGAESTSM